MGAAGHRGRLLAVADLRKAYRKARALQGSVSGSPLALPQQARAAKPGRHADGADDAALRPGDGPLLRERATEALTAHGVEPPRGVAP